ncbi:sulfotransferase family protein [Sphaerisporangium album]|uniref:Sulfotransferase family protein n=1 Tax=Sphaerisporangium album TaxID=509200 RepID=A0A367FSC9_9ACTN|nr:sulfotransferase family protein [Sphaerisporangium album]RCG32702.1 sulfotransferase family protein [Sphaerisporangium album]
MLEVIGAGMGRTGTYSLKTALERLGHGPCHHMASLDGDLARIGAWEAAVRGAPTAWEDVLGGYRATVDWPSCYFWEDLVSAYPEARVVLTVRDPHRWYASVHETIYRSSHRQPGWAGLAMRLEDRASAALRHRRRLCERVIWQGTFGGRFDDEAYAVDVFDWHIAHVMAEVPPDRLLVYNVCQGWGPLCDFLGDPVPGEPFPRLNDTASFQRMASRRRHRVLTLRPIRADDHTAVR